MASEALEALGSDLVITRDGTKPPPYVESRMKRGRDRMREGAPFRAQAVAFWSGNQYVNVNGDRTLVDQPTVTNTDGSGKPRHRVRRVFNLLAPVVGHKVSTSTQRVPSYKVDPGNPADSSDVDAARISQQIALYGYDKWDIRLRTKEVVTYALVSDEGFAMPYFDTSVGPYYEDGTGEGDIRIRTYSANEVYWEPGVAFADSPWCAIEQARPVYEVRQMPGFIGESLSADARVSEYSSFGLSGAERQASNTQLVLVTEYYERPTAKNARGRWLTFANNRLILPPDEYPCQDGKGNVVDEPVLHKLTFITDPHSDRDMGLVRFLVDAQRTFNSANNKQLEWMFTALNPQAVAKNGKLVQRLNDEPGMLYEFWGSGDLQWRETPPIPPELSQIKQEVRDIIQFIAADQDIPQGVEAARSIQALVERDEGVWASFYADLAQFHARLMRHCLYLVQRFYTEERTIHIRGDFGPESLSAFTGAQLMGQADVRVQPDSIIPVSRQEQEGRVRYYAEMGWVSPEQAMSAIEGGQSSNLVESYERDRARAQRIIQALRAGPEAFLGQSNPENPLPPEWMPREFDNIAVHKQVFSDWMKTEDYERAEIPVQFAAQLYYQYLKQLEAMQAAEEAMRREQMAQGLGMQNAARPGTPPPLPTMTQPGTGFNGGDSGPPPRTS
jgi:hypothetical protein